MLDNVITVILPAYNEEQDLPALLVRLEACLSAEQHYRVLVVDDGSSDNTAAVVRTASARIPIDMIRHSVNLGLGAAIRTGLLHAATFGGVIVTMDSDNSHDPELIRTMVARISEGFDVIIASRYQVGSKQLGVPVLRRFLSATCSIGLRALVPYRGVRDYTSGYRAYRAEVIRSSLKTYGEQSFIKERGFACMLELLLKLRVARASVAEVPLILRYDLKRGKSKMRILRTIRRYAAVVFGA